jgi:hypothetical protein
MNRTPPLSGRFPGNSSGTTGQGEEFVSDFKLNTLTIAAGVWPNITTFFKATPNADPTRDNYDGANFLVTSGKKFTIMSIGLHVYSACIRDIDAIINRGVLKLQTQLKDRGTFPCRRLTEAGGLWVASSQIAATTGEIATANTDTVLGVCNGVPQNSPFNISPLEIDTNQTFNAILYGPTADPYTFIDQVTVQLILEGFETRPAA